MPIQNGAYVAPDWENETYPAINQEELNAISQTLELSPIENGGTGANTASGARANLGLGSSTGPLGVEFGGTGSDTPAGARNSLGITPENIGAVSSSGGTVTGDLTITGTLNANTANISGSLPISSGGTGADNVASARNNLGLGNTAGPVPVENGGTGAVTAASARNNLDITPANIGAVSTAGGTMSGDLRFSAGMLVLCKDQYGTTLPPAGTPGRVFFKKL